MILHTTCHGPAFDLPELQTFRKKHLTFRAFRPSFSCVCENREGKTLKLV